MDGSTEHFVQVKSESTIDSNQQDFATKLSFSIMDPNNHHDSHFEQSFYPDNWTTSTEQQTALVNSYTNHQGLSVSHNTISYESQLPVLRLSLSACHGGLLPCGTSPSPWLSPSDHSPISPNSFLNPQATLLSYNENNHPTSENISSMYTDIDRDAYERISQWSRPNARFESLAATTPEDGIVQSTEAYTPATSFEDEDEEKLSMPHAAGCGLRNDSTAELTRRRTNCDTNGISSVATASSPQPMAVHQHELHVHESPDDISSSAGTISSAASSSSSSSSSPPEQSEEPRLRTKDEYLLAMRKQGISYKEIKRRGKFTEAESTLRGRVRNLVKAKKDRVRKPIWTKHDIKLLRAAVRRHFQYGAYGRSSSNQKLPWKKVAEWIHDHESTYQFGSATCARKWEQIKDSEAR